MNYITVTNSLLEGRTGDVSDIIDKGPLGSIIGVVVFDVNVVDDLSIFRSFLLSHSIQNNSTHIRKYY